jgi:NADH pyrophosphatase NudC (nudix superfamily)
MLQDAHIRYCPACASEQIEAPSENSMLCKQCGYVLFHNTAAATAILLRYKNKLVFVKRGHEPGKGMLDLPGGFVDYNESAEEGVLREISEETGFKVENMKYVGSIPNTYKYKNVLYHTCDICYTGDLESIDSFRPSDEIPELVLLEPNEVDLDKIAFDSLRKMVKRYLNEYS